MDDGVPTLGKKSWGSPEGPWDQEHGIGEGLGQKHPRDKAEAAADLGSAVVVKRGSECGETGLGKHPGSFPNEAFQQQ